MKGISLIREVLKGMLLIVVVGTGVFSIVASNGNGDSKPKIELTSTDCETDKIDVKVESKGSRSGQNYNIITTVTVTCDGKPLPGAEIKITFWWPNGEYKKKTNQDGKYKDTRKKAADPKGQTVKVTIKGNDGNQKVVDVTVQ